MFFSKNFVRGLIVEALSGRLGPSGNTRNIPWFSQVHLPRFSMEEQKNLILFFAGHGQCGEHGLAWFFIALGFTPLFFFFLRRFKKNISQAATGRAFFHGEQEAAFTFKRAYFPTASAGVAYRFFFLLHHFFSARSHSFLVKQKSLCG